MNDISKQFNKATRWSTLTEIAAKLMPPITNMVLARLLVPEAFGMVATVTMITSFADILSDAGFQKYLVQHNFSDDDDLERSTNVAFWTNLAISLFLWCGIILFRHPLAAAVGNGGLGNTIAVASVTIPLTSFSSIQMARFRREFDFKTLFYVRIVSVLIPLFITIPLAFFLKSYWALIWGTIAVSLSNAVLLTWRSKWKPRFFYRFSILREMLSFSMLALTEQLLGWANLNIGIFIVGIYLSDYYLGLYKTSMAYVNQIMGIIVNSLSPVLLSTLSRMKEDKTARNSFFYDFEEKVALIVIPLGIGIFIYRDLFTKILLGNQWTEAVGFIGLWALARSLLIAFGGFSMEVFVSSGKPKYSVFSQIAKLIVLLPLLLITAKMGYRTLYIARSCIVLWSMFVDMILLKIGAGISPIRIIKNSAVYIIFAIIMAVFGRFMLTVSGSILWQFASVLLCIGLYFGLLLLHPKSKKCMKGLKEVFLKKE